MGSISAGLIPGYVCRLCSKMSSYVILIFGNDGIELELEHKIRSCLPVKIERDDELPKTVCIDCVLNLNCHYAMLKVITKRMTKLEEMNSSKLS